MMKKEKINSIKYKNFIDGLKLLNIRILSSGTSVDEKFLPPANLELNQRKKYIKTEGNIFKVIHEYTLKGIKNGEANPGFKIKVKYQIIYKSDIPITDDIFKIFSQTNLLLHTWPYFRQFVHEMTNRMGLPPLVLDVLKIK